MRWFKEEERFHCITPLGKAVCWGLCVNLPDPEWLTFIDSTGEPFFWTNKHFRRAPNVTNGWAPVTPFGKINKELQGHIARYKKLGKLPERYDPTNIATW